MPYRFAEGDTEIISYMPGHCCSYCTGLLSKDKHYTFQRTAPLLCNTTEGTHQHFLLVATIPSGSIPKRQADKTLTIISIFRRLFIFKKKALEYARDKLRLPWTVQ